METNFRTSHTVAPAGGQCGRLPKALAGDAREIRRGHRPATMERIAKGGLLLPADGADLKKAGKIADAAVTQGKTHGNLPYFQFADGLAQYRREQFREPIATLQTVLAAKRVLFSPSAGVCRPRHGASRPRPVHRSPRRPRQRHRAGRDSAAQSRRKRPRRRLEGRADRQTAVAKRPRRCSAKSEARIEQFREKIADGR